MIKLFNFKILFFLMSGTVGLNFYELTNYTNINCIHKGVCKMELELWDD